MSTADLTGRAARLVLSGLPEFATASTALLALMVVRRHSRITMTAMRTRGLSTAEAMSGLETTGPNALPEPTPDPLWRRFARQFESPLIYILLVALVIDLVIWTLEGADGLAVESLAIGCILLLDAGLGVYQEGKAEAALQRLKQLAASWDAHAWGVPLRALSTAAALVQLVRPPCIVELTDI